VKPRNVHVSVVDSGADLYVNITLRIPGSLPKEDPPNSFRVKEGARKKKQKAVQQTLEAVEFNDE
jgi:hypothetical protein